MADIEDALRFVERNTRTAYRIEGLRRSNIPEYPTNALREAITNAVMHRDWFIDGANVFVEIYTDRIEVVSPGSLPQGLQLTDLGSRSIRRIRNETRTQGSPEPKFEANGFFTVTFRPNPKVRASGDVRSMHDATTEDTMEVTMEVTKAARLLQAITSEMGAMTRQELRSLLGLKNDEYFRKAYLLPALRAGLIEMTIPDKPRSQNQRYRLTSEGRDSTDGRSVYDATMEDTTEADTEVTMEVTEAARLLQAITSEMGAMTRQELRSLLGLKNDEYFRKAYLLPALRAGLIEMTIPDKPRSQNQRYRPTPEGRDVLRRTSESQ